MSFVSWISRLILKYITNRRLLLLLTCSVIVSIIYQFNLLQPAIFSINPPAFLQTSDWNFSSESDQNCQIPNLNPFDPLITDYIPKAQVIKCDWPEPQLTMICRDGVLRFNMSAMKEAGYTVSALNCSYQQITRPDGQDDITKYEPEQPMTGNDVMEHEFVYVHCKTQEGVVIYTNLHAHMRNLMRQLYRRTSKDRNLSILVFFIDSLSRMNAIRYLPNTYYFLTRVMEAQVMKGMTRVGGNTWPNAMAMLTGKKANTEELKSLPLGQYYDDYPTIWRNFSKDDHYVTLLAEDFPIYTIFNQVSSGFYKQPTDHYFRPFWVALNSLNMSKASSTSCFGKVPRYSFQVNYLRDFAIKYSDVPYFAFAVFTELGHDHMSGFGSGDDATAKFLSDLYLGGYLENTILFFIGDHGHRTHPLAVTPSGRIEINMPFSAIYVPQSIRSQFPDVIQNMVINSKRLTSNFDYYETFVDVLRYATLGLPLGKGRTDRWLWPKRRSYSFFESIPSNRTCDDSGIEFTFCSCSISETIIPTSDDRAKMAANTLVEHINFLIQNHTKLCANWKFSKFLSVRLLGDSVMKNVTTPTSQNVLLAVEVHPGGAIFDGTVQLTDSGAVVGGKVLGTVIRVNRYKGQDTCLTRQIRQAVIFDIRPFCYCRSKINA